MRLFFQECAAVILVTTVAAAQGTPPPDTADAAQTHSQNSIIQVHGGPPAAFSQAAPLQQFKSLVKREITKAIDRNSCPNIENWAPLSTRQKFDVFLKHTYAPATFTGAGIDAMKFKIRGDDGEYETGWRGLGQRAGINLATSESNVFFERFLVPSLLKQDPRYFRNPNLPFLKRAWYSMSRVVVTRSDRGNETFNGSKIIGGAISQALSDLYVPGERQGLHPIANRVTFNLIRDAGFNLVHEFWPDIRRKVLHR